MSETLKQCPFCGTSGKLVEKFIGDDVDTYWDVECTNYYCYLYGGAEWCLDTKAEAASKWNTRELVRDIYTVDSTHTDPIQKETATVLKWRQRARVAEDSNKEMYDAISSALAIKDLWTYDSNDYMASEHEGKALNSMLILFQNIIKKGELK